VWGGVEARLRGNLKFMKIKAIHPNRSACLVACFTVAMQAPITDKHVQPKSRPASSFPIGSKTL
jgi:hypothetical protein